jgi:hypothetical protein
MNEELVQRVYRAFDPAPLRAVDDGLYVDLDEVRGSTGFTTRLANRIRLSDTPTCQVVTGHRGSGKSTELHRLKQRLEDGKDPPFVVYCEADEDIDRNDVDFPEVLIAIVRQMAGQLKDRLDISLKPGYFKDRLQRLMALLESEVTFEGAELGNDLMSLSATVRSSPDARLKLRKLLEPDTGNWLKAANNLIGEAKLALVKKGFRDLVIIVDDLDKMIMRPHAEAACSTCEYLFVHREAQLTGFDCHLVYTMPIACAYSAMEAAIANLYGGHPPVVPMTRLSSRPPSAKPYEPGIQKFRDIVESRLAKAEAESSQVFKSPYIRDGVIRLSGGQPRELMILVRECIAGSGLPIDEAAVDRAAREGRRAYARQLRAEHWPILEAVRKSGSLDRDDTNDAQIRELLDSRAVLQYINEEEWYGVNPLVTFPKKPPRGSGHSK